MALWVIPEVALMVLAPPNLTVLKVTTFICRFNLRLALIHIRSLGGDAMLGDLLYEETGQVTGMEVLPPEDGGVVLKVSLLSLIHI